MFLLRQRQHVRTIVQESVAPRKAKSVIRSSVSKMSSSSSEVPKWEFNNIFSDENKAKTIARIRDKSTGFKYLQTAMMKRAAVLIPLCFDTQGSPCFLYTLRSLKLANHKGEICFPGNLYVYVVSIINAHKIQSNET